MDQTTAPDWFLRDWLAHFNKRQSSLVNELGWDKATANFLYHSKQPYRRDHINDVSRWLGIEPFELLLPPRRALALRRLRETAFQIAAEDGREFDHQLDAGGDTDGRKDDPARRKR
jgi:hypothetical protein